MIQSCQVRRISACAVEQQGMASCTDAAGKTPLDLALELRAQNIIRSFERYALFAGYVNMKVSAGLMAHLTVTS